MDREAVRRVVDLWAEQSVELGARYRWVQVFENQGSAMGASNPHPHGQVWATAAIPVVAGREDATQRLHWLATGRSLLRDYVGAEFGGPRRVHESDDVAVVVPFWATWPFELLVVPRRSVARLPELLPGERDAITTALIDVLTALDVIFEGSSPYSMGWHQAPFGGGDGGHWQLHAHIYPPMLRPGVRKFMVGYELLSEEQRDISPEVAAERLREARSGSTLHPGS
jgi:UDPglucose--hexose-1-phosphate uridylyltransferase